MGENSYVFTTLRQQILSFRWEIDPAGTELLGKISGALEETTLGRILPIQFSMSTNFVYTQLNVKTVLY